MINHDNLRYGERIVSKNIASRLKGDIVSTTDQS